MSIINALGLIGVGNMGSALLRGVIESGLVPAGSVWVFDIDAQKCGALASDLGVCVAESNAHLLGQVDTVILAVKPQIIGPVLKGLASEPLDGKRFISIAAGISTSMLERSLGGEARVVRVMPNTPAMLGKGAAGAARGAFATPEDMAAALAIASSVGVAFEVDEAQINAVTGLSGSGPAYVFRMVEALGAAGEKVGLPAEMARKLAAQTVLGAALMVEQTGEDPAELRRKVTSPNGTTEAGLKIMEDAGFMEMMERTVARAAERGEELGRMFE